MARRTNVYCTINVSKGKINVTFEKYKFILLDLDCYYLLLELFIILQNLKSYKNRMLSAIWS